MSNHSYTSKPHGFIYNLGTSSDLQEVLLHHVGSDLPYGFSDFFIFWLHIISINSVILRIYDLRRTSIIFRPTVASCKVNFGEITSTVQTIYQIINTW
jgi:hypothetical protein